MRICKRLSCLRGNASTKFVLTSFHHIFLIVGDVDYIKNITSVEELVLKSFIQRIPWLVFQIVKYKIKNYNVIKLIGCGI